MKVGARLTSYKQIDTETRKRLIRERLRAIDWVMRDVFWSGNGGSLAYLRTLEAGLLQELKEIDREESNE